jgi:hypothetical protein
MKREGESKGNDNNNKIIFVQMYYLPKHTENGRIKIGHSTDQSDHSGS